jgi:hypothetical protein
VAIIGLLRCTHASAASTSTPTASPSPFRAHARHRTSARRGRAGRSPQSEDQAPRVDGTRVALVR